MLKLIRYLMAAISVSNYVTCQNVLSTDTAKATEFLAEWNLKYENALHQTVLKTWDFQTNITDFNEEEMVKQETIFAQFQKDMRSEALVFDENLMPPDIKRQLHKMKDIGTAAQPDAAKVEERTKIIADMTSMYNDATIKVKDKDMSLDSGLSDIYAKSRDYDELLTYWTDWRNASGKQMRNLYAQYVELSNEAVRFLDYKDYGVYWRSAFDSDSFLWDVRLLFRQVWPLYEQLHAFVRKRLMNVYGAQHFPESGHIPAHLLGEMHAMIWTDILDLVKPFPDKPAMDVTEELVKQNYTAERFFREAEDFFHSLGFDNVAPSFWTDSIFEEPKDGRKIVCHASAWDFYNQKDFRIKMCTSITHMNLMIAHHEFGHIQNCIEYKDQPAIYKDAANPAFHEALGDAIALSVQTPEHMKKLGLIETVIDDHETDINFLMGMALQKVAFLPFAFVVDHWRWFVFANRTTPSTYNKDWWGLRCKAQGITPPIPRSDDDFDPGSKFHIPADAPYMIYFLSFITQFQFHKGLCTAAGHTGPLHRCDIYDSKAAGSKLRQMLKMGSSQPWPVALKELTGDEVIDAGPLLEYFEPLYNYLKEQNGYDYGWTAECPVKTY